MHRCRAFLASKLTWQHPTDRICIDGQEQTCKLSSVTCNVELQLKCHWLLMSTQPLLYLQSISISAWHFSTAFHVDITLCAAVVHDTEAGMSSAYPAANTYTSPAFANSPRAATTTAPRGWFARKPATAAGPLTAGAAAAAATSTATSDHTGSVPVSTSNPVGPLETATRTPAQTAAPSSYGAFTQHNGHQRSVSSPAQEQSMQAVPEAAAEAAGGRNVVYARESEMGPVGPSGATGAFGPSQANNTNGALYNDNKAGFFQSA